MSNQPKWCVPGYFVCPRTYARVYVRKEKFVYGSFVSPSENTVQRVSALIYTSEISFASRAYIFADKLHVGFFCIVFSKATGGRVTYESHLRRD